MNFLLFTTAIVYLLVRFPDKASEFSHLSPETERFPEKKQLYVLLIMAATGCLLLLTVPMAYLEEMYERKFSQPKLKKPSLD
ncbi:MAG: hypothetical protein ACFBSC_15230 [Microcoleaceae cyanobacterium]